MEFHPLQDLATDRLHDYYQPIAQFTSCEYELDRVDCHTRQEAMGDGHIYGSQKDAQYVQGRTCHGTLDAPPRTRTLRNPNDIALRQAFLNPVIDLMIGDTIVVTEKDEALWNIRKTTDGAFEMAAKATG